MPTVTLSERCTRMVNATGVLRKAIVDGATTVILPRTGRMYCPGMAYNIPNGVTIKDGTISGGFRIPDSAWSAVDGSDVNHANLPSGYSGIYVAALDQTIGLGTWVTNWDSPGTPDVGLHVDGVPATRAATDWLVPSATTTTSVTFTDINSGLTADGQLLLQIYSSGDASTYQEYDDNTFKVVTGIATKTFSWSGALTLGTGSKRTRLLNHPKLLTANGMFWVDRTNRRVYYKSASAPSNTCVDTLPGDDTSGITGAVLQHNGRSSGTLSGVRIESTRGTCYVAYNSSGLTLTDVTTVGGQRGFRLQSASYNHDNCAISNLVSHHHATNCAWIHSGAPLTATSRSNTVATVTASYSGLRSNKWGEGIRFEGYGLSPTGVSFQYGPRIGIIWQMPGGTLASPSVLDSCQHSGDMGAIYFGGNDAIGVCPGRTITNPVIRRCKKNSDVIGTGNMGVYGDNYASEWSLSGGTYEDIDYVAFCNSGHNVTIDLSSATITGCVTNRIWVRQFVGGAYDTPNSTIYDLAAAVKSVYQSIHPAFYAKANDTNTNWQKPTGVVLSWNTGDGAPSNSIAVTWPTGEAGSTTQNGTPVAG